MFAWIISYGKPCVQPQRGYDLNWYSVIQLNISSLPPQTLHWIGILLSLKILGFLDSRVCRSTGMSPSGSSLPKLSFNSLKASKIRLDSCPVFWKCTDLMIKTTQSMSWPVSSNCNVIIESETAEYKIHFSPISTFWPIYQSSDWHLHVFSGDLVEALRQLSHQRLVSTHQQAPDLLRDPSIVEQTLSSGGRERRRQWQLVQHYNDNGKTNQIRWKIKWTR